jgi:hypothetical protein
MILISDRDRERNPAPSAPVLELVLRCLLSSELPTGSGPPVVQAGEHLGEHLGELVWASLGASSGSGMSSATRNLHEAVGVDRTRPRC